MSTFDDNIGKAIFGFGNAPGTQDFGGGLPSAPPAPTAPPQGGGVTGHQSLDNYSVPSPQSNFGGGGFNGGNDNGGDKKYTFFDIGTGYVNDNGEVFRYSLNYAYGNLKIDVHSPDNISRTENGGGFKINDLNKTKAKFTLSPAFSHEFNAKFKLLQSKVISEFTVIGADVVRSNNDFKPTPVAVKIMAKDGNVGGIFAVGPNNQTQMQLSLNGVSLLASVCEFHINQGLSIYFPHYVNAMKNINR